VDVGKRTLGAVVAVAACLVAGLASRGDAIPSHGYRTNFYDRSVDNRTRVLVGWQRLTCSGYFSSSGTATEHEVTVEWECPDI
jgi:hypothetical protein